MNAPADARADEASEAPSALALGIDIGTTSIKAVVLERVAKKTRAPAVVVCSASLDHGVASAVATCPRTTRHEQDVDVIWRTLAQCVQRVLSSSPHLRARVRTVGVSSQMHSLVLWRRSPETIAHAQRLWASSSSNDACADTDATATAVHSNNVTWIDQRCSAAELAEWNALAREQEQQAHQPPSSTSSSSPLWSGSLLQSGYGCATLAWYARHEPHMLRDYDCAGTIGDYFVWLLSAAEEREGNDAAATPVLMHTTNAASWGCYDMQTRAWRTAVLERLGVPLALLPHIVADTTATTPVRARAWSALVGGHASAESTVSCIPCIGDAQAALYALQLEPHQAALYMGTSAQLSVLAAADSQTVDVDVDVDVESGRTDRSDRLRAGLGDVFARSSDAQDDRDSAIPSVEYRPYVLSAADSRVLMCASLNGGNVLAWVAQSAREMVNDMRVDAAPLDLAQVYDVLHRRALAALEQRRTAASTSMQHDAVVVSSVRMFGERHVLPRRDASALTIHIRSGAPAFALGEWYLATCEALVRNLRAMFLRSTAAARAHKPIDEVIAFGGAISRQADLFQPIVESVFGVRCTCLESAASARDAAFGVALLSCDSCR